MVRSKLQLQQKRQLRHQRRRNAPRGSRCWPRQPRSCRLQPRSLQPSFGASKRQPAIVQQPAAASSASPVAQLHSFAPPPLLPNSTRRKSFREPSFFAASVSSGSAAWLESSAVKTYAGWLIFLRFRYKRAPVSAVCELCGRRSANASALRTHTHATVTTRRSSRVGSIIDFSLTQTSDVARGRRHQVDSGTKLSSTVAQVGSGKVIVMIAKYLAPMTSAKDRR